MTFKVWGRLVEAGLDPALDRGQRRVAAVVLNGTVLGGRIIEPLLDDLLVDPSAPDHGREPEGCLVQGVIPAARVASGKVGTATIQSGVCVLTFAVPSLTGRRCRSVRAVARRPLGVFLAPPGVPHDLGSIFDESHGLSLGEER